jgi:hypothetical protein
VINEKALKAANFIWPIYLLIMLHILLLRPSLRFTTDHPTTLHSTSLHLSTLHLLSFKLHFTQLHFYESRPAVQQPSLPVNYTAFLWHGTIVAVLPFAVDIVILAVVSRIGNFITFTLTYRFLAWDSSRIEQFVKKLRSVDAINSVFSHKNYYWQQIIVVIYTKWLRLRKNQNK